MTAQIEISNDTLELTNELEEAIYHLLRERLPADMFRLVHALGSLHTYRSIADGTLHAVPIAQADAPISLLDTVAEIIQVLPRASWPDRLESYVEQAPLAIEALQVLAWRSGLMPDQERGDGR